MGNIKILEWYMLQVVPFITYRSAFYSSSTKVMPACYSNAALTHTSQPYCDLKTSKIAFFFRKSFGFLSNFSRRRPGALQSCVYSMSSIRPFYVHGVSTATILRPQGDPTAIIGDPDATVLRSLRPYGDYCVLTTMLLRLWRLPRT